VSTTTSAPIPGEERVRKPIPPADQTWLLMDRPNNLMHVRSLMWFDEPVDVDAVRRLLEDRLIGRHPVFRRRAVEHDGEWYWEDDPEFDLDHHVRVVGLEGDEGTSGPGSGRSSPCRSIPSARSGRWTWSPASTATPRSCSPDSTTRSPTGSGWCS
jgi:diacylglycerol O-acyltransferase